MDELLSVVVPIYNVESDVEKCITSIQASTYTNIEIILVDDGSSDSSGYLCDKYENLDKRIKVIHKENGGLVSARKAGVKKASGDYITFVDGDDYVSNYLFEKALQKIITTKTDMTSFGYNRCDTYGNIQGEYVNELSEGIYSASDSSIYFDEEKNSLKFIHSVWSKVFNASLLRKAIEYVDDSVTKGEDLNLTLSYLKLSNSFYVDNSNTGYFYVDRNTSMTNVYDKDSIKHTGNYIISSLKLCDPDISSNKWNKLVFNEAFNLILSDCIGCAFKYYGKKRIVSLVKFFKRLAEDSRINNFLQLGIEGGYFSYRRWLFADFLIKKSYFKALIMRIYKKTL